MNNFNTPNIFLVRHAESIANVQKIITSSYQTQLGIGLSHLGIKQAKKASLFFKKAGIKPYILSSDFDRAKQTAEIISKETSTSIHLNTLLRERYFGVFDNHSADHYSEIWDADSKGIIHPSVESLHSVFQRMWQVIKNVKRLKVDNIVLVSHGDSLLILEAGYKKIPLTSFRSLREFDNAEIRLLKKD